MALEKILKWGAGVIAGIYFSLANVNCQVADSLKGFVKINQGIISRFDSMPAPWAKAEKGPNSRAEQYDEKIRIVTGIKENETDAFSLVDNTPIYNTNKGSSKFYIVEGDTLRYNKHHYFRILKNDTIELAKSYNRVIDMDIRDFNRDKNFDFIVLKEMSPGAPKDSSKIAHYASMANNYSSLSLLISDKEKNYNEIPLYDSLPNSIVKIALLPEGGLAMFIEETPVKSLHFIPGAYYALYSEWVLKRNENGKISFEPRKKDIEWYSNKFPDLKEELIPEVIKKNEIILIPKRDFERCSK